MNKRIKKKKQRQENKKLCERYPFLIPRNRWTDQILWESETSWYYTHPYSFTELDSMPNGWRRAFGEKMCEELREELIKYNFLNNYRITQIKEKWGELRWYDGGIPRNSKIWDIINKYTELSTHTCIHCGRPAEIINNMGWYEPICDKCLEKQNKRIRKIYGGKL